MQMVSAWMPQHSEICLSNSCIHKNKSLFMYELQSSISCLSKWLSGYRAGLRTRRLQVQIPAGASFFFLISTYTLFTNKDFFLVLHDNDETQLFQLKNYFEIILIILHSAIMSILYQLMQALNVVCLDSSMCLASSSQAKGSRFDSP